MLSPKATTGLTRLTLGAPKLLHVAEGIVEICVRVPLAHHFEIHEGIIRKVEIRQRAAILVEPLRVVFDADGLPFHQLAEKCGGFLAERLNGHARVHRLGCIDPDETHGSNVAEHERIAVNHSHDLDTLSRAGCRECARREATQQES